MMVDLHCHVLPGIDDGAQHFDESIAMCRRAIEDGCTAVVATPHQRTEPWDPRDVAALSALREQLQERVGEELRLLPGAEVRIDSELLDELERLPSSGLLPLAASRYLLLEFQRSPAPVGVDPFDLLHELAVAGWRPIFAHPEFIPWLATDPDLAGALVERGALFQLTAMSVTGDFGRRAQAVCETYLDRGLAHFVASDAHGPDRRPPGLSRARGAIAARWGVDAARRLTADNPLAVIENRPIVVEAAR
jgi:protein-tyrosine phosphatase